MLPQIGRHEHYAAKSSAQEQRDGPYVQYNSNNQVLVNYIIETNGVKTVKKDSVAVKQKDKLSLNVMTDIPGKSFQVSLKKKLQNEKFDFSSPTNLFILSDLEGNFGAFRKLLQANKIITDDFQWQFNNGHLVLIGDFFDRGEQVTELLWFIYSLEEKAKAAGGYVHFILGNHEIMNLTDDLRYLNKKYLENAALLDQKYISLYDENSELGRWLRTKNIIERIGDIIFTHGGISSAINKLNLSLREINKLARPYYADTIYQYEDAKSDIIFSNLGPFWYRGYYDEKNTSVPLQIDSTLSQFKARQIITGHSIVADTVSMWYGGRLFNTDVPHSTGKSEALLIEKDTYYRVDINGKKSFLKQAGKR